jgi:Serine carboxypeptidase S28
MFCFIKRYLANDEFYRAGGPIFTFVGGAWEIDGSYLQGGHTFDMAREMNGYLLCPENRYYGINRKLRVATKIGSTFFWFLTSYKIDRIPSCLIFEFRDFSRIIAVGHWTKSQN